MHRYDGEATGKENNNKVIFYYRKLKNRLSFRSKFKELIITPPLSDAISSTIIIRDVPRGFPLFLI